MNKTKGFTLVELLAVIVILAIILVIAVPGISGLIQSSTKGAFQSDAKMILTAINYKTLETSSFDPTSINASTITSLDLSNANYEYIKVVMNNNVPNIVVVGKNKWQGLIACGSMTNMSVADATTSITCSAPFDFSYVGGSAQTFNAPITGKYKIEVWGASGAGDGSVQYGGQGGYSTGVVSFTNGQAVYVYVGGTGASAANNGGGFNGGGNAGPSGSSGGGGGATDVRTGGTNVSNRIIVAGGGGGAGNGGSNYSGAGGGLTGGNGYNSTTNGATQASGGTSASGNGALFQGANHTGDGGGGGGGYYGGGAGNGDSNGGGGSAYIGGVTSGQTIAGNASMPNPNGNTETGHNGNGYARITYIGQ